MAEIEQRKSRSSWCLWWQLDQDELRKQAKGYSSLKFWKSARAGAVVCLLISIVITGAAVYFRLMGVDSSALVDVGLMAFLAVFIGLGHRWAMIVAMLYWTVSKTFAIWTGVQSGTGGFAITQVIWWAIYMHAFYFSFRVEQMRRKPVTDPEVFS